MTTAEDTDELIVTMAEQFGVELTPGDIDRPHRVGPPTSTNPRPVLIRFTSHQVGNECAKPVPKLKDKVQRIFLNEDLTRSRAQSASKSRLLKIESKIIDTWTYDGCVFIKADTGATKILHNAPHPDREINIV